MPTFDFLYWKENLGDTLASTGPIVPVEVSMPQALQEFFNKNNIPIPPSQTGYALIDTGASVTAIEESVLTQMSILPIDSIPSSSTHVCGGNPGPAQFEYYALWESINGVGSWSKNPFVWVISFKKL